MKGQALHALEHALGVDQAAGLGRCQIDLAHIARDHGLAAKADAGQEHLHLFGRGVLRLVQDHKGVVERAPAHEGEWCDFDLLALKRFLHLLKPHQIVEGVVQGAQVRVHFLAQVAGQKAEFFTGFHGGAGEHDALHRAALKRVDRAGHGQIGLAGAGRANAKGDVVAGHALQVQGLVGGAPTHLAAPGLHAQSFVARRGQGGVAAEHELNLLGRDGFFGHLVQGLQHLQSLLGFGLGAFDAELLKAVRHLDLQARFDAADVAVQRAAQVGHAGVVGRGKSVSENQTDNP